MADRSRELGGYAPVASKTGRTERPAKYMELDENLRRQSEARYWIEQYNEQPKRKAVIWWQQVISNIERIRGKEAADQLRADMNAIRSKG